MLKFLKTAVLALGTAACAAAALPAPASADGITLSLDENGPRFGVYLAQEGRRGWRDDDGPRDGWRGDDDGPRRGGWRDDDDGWDGGPPPPPRWHRRPPPPPRCSPAEALDKAASLGLRRVRILDVDRRTIEVAGRRFGERRVVTFARAPFCPVIDW